MKSTKIAAVSMVSQFGRTEDNFEHMLGLIEQAAQQQVDLVCFPEIALQGYHADKQRMRQDAQTEDSPICRHLIESARAHRLVASVGMAYREGQKVYNAQVFFGPDGILGFAPKVHLCGEELDIFDCGNEWPVIDLGFARIGTVICYDAGFPEAARCLALDGAEIILMSFATGRRDLSGRKQDPKLWREQVLRWAPARAYDNRVFVVAVNHAGNVRDEDNVVDVAWAETGEIHRWPAYSFVVDPSGELIAESARDHNNERVLFAELDPQRLDRWRQGVGDFLKHRRPETYRRLTSNDPSFSC